MLGDVFSNSTTDTRWRRLIAEIFMEGELQFPSDAVLDRILDELRRAPRIELHRRLVYALRPTTWGLLRVSREYSAIGPGQYTQSDVKSGLHIRGRDAHISALQLSSSGFLEIF